MTTKDYNAPHTGGIRYQGGHPACACLIQHPKHPGLHNCGTLGIHTPNGPRCFSCLANDLGWTKSVHVAHVTQSNRWTSEEESKRHFLADSGLPGETIDLLDDLRTK